MVGHARRKELGVRPQGRSSPLPTRKQALTIAASVAEKWRKKGNEKVAEHLEEHIEECLSCLAFPESSPQAHPHHERAGEAQRGDKAAQAGW